MKNNQKIFYLALLLVIVVVAIAFIHQQKRISHLAEQLNGLSDQTDQSSLAAKMALQQSTELVHAIESNQDAAMQAQAEWENREPIGFIYSKVNN